MYEFEVLRTCCGTVNTTLSLQDSQFPKFQSFITTQ